MWLSNSSIGRKVVMSITGLFLVLFLTFHMCMNLVALISPAGYNAVCQFLGANWYALAAKNFCDFPKSGRGPRPLPCFSSANDVFPL